MRTEMWTETWTEMWTEMWTEIVDRNFYEGNLYIFHVLDRNFWDPFWDSFWDGFWDTFWDTFLDTFWHTFLDTFWDRTVECSQQTPVGTPDVTKSSDTATTLLCTCLTPTVRSHQKSKWCETKLKTKIQNFGCRFGYMSFSMVLRCSTVLVWVKHGHKSHISKLEVYYCHNIMFLPRAVLTS